MIQEVSYTQARQRLASLMDQVTDTREPVLIPSSWSRARCLDRRRRVGWLAGDSAPFAIAKKRTTLA